MAARVPIRLEPGARGGARNPIYSVTLLHGRVIPVPYWADPSLPSFLASELPMSWGPRQPRQHGSTAPDVET